MRPHRRSLAPLVLCFTLAACGAGRDAASPSPDEPRAAAPRPADAEPAPAPSPKEPAPMSDQVRKSESEWKAALTPTQYHVLREKGTERAFSGAYWDTKTPGLYRCAGCGAELFRSEAKFDSGCGWPSFDRELAKGRIVETPDLSLGMVRTEVTCARCGGHLGHLFDDGPTETGMRYCINSASILLVPDPGAK